MEDCNSKNIQHANLTFGFGRHSVSHPERHRFHHWHILSALFTITKYIVETHRGFISINLEPTFSDTWKNKGRSKNTTISNFFLQVIHPGNFEMPKHHHSGIIYLSSVIVPSSHELHRIKIIAVKRCWRSLHDCVFSARYVLESPLFYPGASV